MFREGGGGGGGLRGIDFVPKVPAGGATRDSASVYSSSSEDEGDDMDESESKGFPVLFRGRLKRSSVAYTPSGWSSMEVNTIVLQVRKWLAIIDPPLFLVRTRRRH